MGSIKRTAQPPIIEEQAKTVRGHVYVHIDFPSISTIFYWIFELFRRCGIFFFILFQILISPCRVYIYYKHTAFS